MTRAAPLLLLSTLCAGCPTSHRVDGELDGGNGWTDATAGPDAAARDANGLDSGIEPEPCVVPDRECWCWSETRERTRAQCITPRGAPLEFCDVIGNGCSTPDHLCNDIGNNELGPDYLAGVCTSTAMCAWLRARDSRAWCYYEDGTLYDTGVLASEPCDAAESGLVCGPGCGGCSSGRECIGVSERSGLGLCVRSPVAESPDRCGELHAECGSGQACVGFVLPDGISFASQASVWHGCVSREACARLEARYPDRFYCRG